MNKKDRRSTTTSPFAAVFRRIRRREKFESPPAERLREELYEAVVAAALAKCVEFNIIVNRTRRHEDEDFSLVSGLRGICEDLIYLSYISRFERTDRSELIHILMNLNLAEGLDAQSDFFKVNNPFQPVLRSTKGSASSGESASLAARREFRSFWNGRGSSRRDGPTIREMATSVGLNSTYNYIYFAASNFSHFNPQSLLRMGWGSAVGPFKFSMKNINSYYKSLSSFYGSVLFIGFYSAFELGYFSTDCNSEVEKILEIISGIHRWPELVTFEEMNQKPPLFILTHVLRQAAGVEANSPYGAILEEVRGLRARLQETLSAQN